jgi:hypothetical protein
MSLTADPVRRLQTQSYFCPVTGGDPNPCPAYGFLIAFKLQPEQQYAVRAYPIYEAIMRITRSCPVCADRDLTPILRKTMLDTSASPAGRALLAYRCSQGHFFIAAEDDEETYQEPAA